MLYVNSSRTFVVLAASLMLLMSSAPSAPAAAPGLTGPPSSVATAVAPTVKSYREWKISMVSEAETRLKTTRENILSRTRTSASSKDPNLVTAAGIEAGLSHELKTMQNQFDKEQLQLSMAHDLTISDYFVGYLTKQKEIDKAIKEVSSRLTAEEVAELMSAYANNFFSSTPAATKAAPHAALDQSLAP